MRVGVRTRLASRKARSEPKPCLLTARACAVVRVSMHKEDLDAAETLVCGESAPLCYGRFVSLQHKAVVHSWEEGLAQGGSADASFI